MVSKSCPKGMIKRRSYTAKRGSKNIRVPSSCIRSTSSKQIKRSDIDKAYIAKREKIQNQVSQKYGSKKCPRNQIERAGFTRKGFERKSFRRKDGTIVRATNVRGSEVPPICIRDTGKIGKGTKLPLVLEKDVLKKFGYSDVKNMSVQRRHSALRKAYQEMGNPLSLFRRLNVVSTMNRNKDPKVARIFKDDANWVRENFGLMRSGPHSGSKTSRSSSSNRRSGSTYNSRSNKSRSSAAGAKPSKQRKSTQSSKTGRSRLSTTGSKSNGQRKSRSSTSGSKSSRIRKNNRR